MKKILMLKHREIVRNDMELARRLFRFLRAKRETLGIGNSDWKLASLLDKLGVESFASGRYNRKYVLR